MLRLANEMKIKVNKRREEKKKKKSIEKEEEQRRRNFINYNVKLVTELIYLSLLALLKLF